MNLSGEKEQGFKEALGYLQAAMAAEKCRACGCFHQLIIALEEAFPSGAGPPEHPRELLETVQAAKQFLGNEGYLNPKIFTDQLSQP